MSVFTKDRDYYRALPLRDLLDEAKRGVNVEWQELATVLVERLEDKELTYAVRYECDTCGAEG